MRQQNGVSCIQNLALQNIKENLQTVPKSADSCVLEPHMCLARPAVHLELQVLKVTGELLLLQTSSNAMYMVSGIDYRDSLGNDGWFSTLAKLGSQFYWAIHIMPSS